ncbi:DNA excision repair protein ERCC-1 [Temnothorax longispinosus]|uniref:DNA excision repair protein ERCC-1 n=1 Tax=Temnothorax longispinosus TaxID=300112 RepID=A0A4S2KSQ4_9HYME|nr:DNA excision repair protein ERCC-1 [Temnothorax longispinosus]
MNNTRESIEDLDNVSSSKQAKNTSFQTAFSNLKKSEFYKDFSVPKPETSLATVLNKANIVFVSPKQKGNPLLKYITNVPWEYSDIVPDYVMGKTTCALFLSIRYHQLNPDYIHERLKLLANAYNLRVLLVQLINALTTVKSINKTDATTLLTTFDTLADIVRAHPNTLALCPGFGLHKAQKLHRILHESFLRTPNLSTK